MRDYQESVTTGQTQMDGQTPDKVIPMFRYASQATQKLCNTIIQYLKQRNEKKNYHMFLRLWSEISLFHKLIYDIAPGRFLIGWDVAVRLWRHR